jgi:hypothetical protein
VRRAAAPSRRSFSSPRWPSAPSRWAPAAQERDAERDGPPRTRTRRVIAIGDHPRVDGLRLNFRDGELELVRGANVTIWHPYDRDVGGTVRGLALGLPSTGAGRVEGLSLGVFGVMGADDLHGITVAGVGAGAGSTLSGISVGGVGVGAGSEVRGIALGGVGVGTGGSVRGIALGGVGAGAGGSVRGALVGGIGAGAGGDVRGLMIGAVGAGAGGSVRGLMVGGVGVGAAGDVRGLSFGGVGVGAGGDLRGLSAGGVGVGAGGDLTGIAVAGVGVGSGGTIRGLGVAGIGVGAPRIRGGAMALVVGADRAHAVVVAPALFRIERGGRFTGGAVSTVNLVRGEQRGLTIGVVNYARSLHGVQLGAINIVRDNPRPYRVLPILNVGRQR